MYLIMSYNIIHPHNKSGNHNNDSNPTAKPVYLMAIYLQLPNNNSKK